jgi:hypothetical protein
MKFSTDPLIISKGIVRRAVQEASFSAAAGADQQTSRKSTCNPVLDRLVEASLRAYLARSFDELPAAMKGVLELCLQ